MYVYGDRVVCLHYQILLPWKISFAIVCRWSSLCATWYIVPIYHVHKVDAISHAIYIVILLVVTTTSSNDVDSMSDGSNESAAGTPTELLHPMQEAPGAFLLLTRWTAVDCLLLDQ